MPDLMTFPYRPHWSRPLVVLTIGMILPASPAWADTADQGRAIATAGGTGIIACATCHGANGEGMAAAGFPYLAGQGAGYLTEQLQNFASRARHNPIMEPIAKAMSPAQIEAVSRYFSQLPKPFDAKALSDMVETYPEKSAVGAWLANRGDWDNNIPACIQCHGPGGVGVGANFPSLAGLPANYLRQQLIDWKGEKRLAGPLSLMGSIAVRMSDAQISAVAGYFAALPASAAGANSAAAPEGGTAIAPFRPENKDFTPPDPHSIPSSEFGAIVKKGQDIFMRPGKYAKGYVGNSLNCASCHLDAGRRPGASPLWAAYVLYPAYRSKNKRVNTLAERLQGCFRYSMNGIAPPADSETIVALQSYMYWLAQGAPTGVKLAGQGFPRLDKAAEEPDYIRGKQVYGRNCALCHGVEGQGQKAEGKTVFPALWGDDSFNWGAGMHSVSTAAAFIKANMPLGKAHPLTDQEAWDVARYMNSHERPQDPRYEGSVNETRKKFHDDPSDLYGQTVNGKVLGQNSKPAGGSLHDK